MNISVDLAFLGVGNDGHLASIFSKKNNKKYPENNLFSISNKKEENFYRVSFKFNYLINLKKIIFVVFDKDKKHLIKNLSNLNFKGNIFSLFKKLKIKYNYLICIKKIY